MTNPLRQQMVARAVQKAHNGKLEINVRNVSMYLPGPAAFDPKLKAMESFELDDTDLSPYLPAPTPEPAMTLAERLADVEIEFVPPEPVEPPAVRYQWLQNRMLELERERVDLSLLPRHVDPRRNQRAQRTGQDRPRVHEWIDAGHAGPVA